MMQDIVIENISRPDAEYIEFFSNQASADVHEAMGKRNAMTAEIESVAGPPQICGSAVTARVTPGDNTMVHVAANVAEAGDVLVFESNTTETATWGELATRNARRKGLNGVVSGGNVRDTEAIDELGFPVFSRAVSQSGARKEGTGSVNIPISVGDVVVRPGDIIVGDQDGVSVVPQPSAEGIKTATEAKREAENAIRKRIENGESLFDLIGVNQILEEQEVRQIEGPVDYQAGTSVGEESPNDGV
jgi:4-hydroxy-4-methyl-2-oxoglutarate aldolase